MIKKHQACRIVKMDSYPDSIAPLTEDLCGTIGIVVKIDINDSRSWYEVCVPCGSRETIPFLAGELEEVTEVEKDIALASHFGLESWL